LQPASLSLGGPASKADRSRRQIPRSLQRLEEQLTQETPMWTASFTKLMTTIAILQCIEKKKLSLDTDVTSILYELGDLKILTGFDESDEPILKQKASIITVKLIDYLPLS